MDNKETKNYIDIVSSIFTHLNREYFKDNLYRKRIESSKKRNIKNFANKLKSWDDREIMCKLFSAVLFDKGIYVCPQGMLWFAPCSKETAELNVIEMKPLFDDYWQWQLEQR